MISDIKSAKTVDKGLQDVRGHWKPTYPNGFSPLFETPIRPISILKWLFGYPGLIWPQTLVYVILAYIVYSFFQPDITKCSKLEFWWIGII
jgi:hypothetical protein